MIYTYNSSLWEYRQEGHKYNLGLNKVSPQLAWATWGPITNQAGNQLPALFQGQGDGSLGNGTGCQV